MSIKAVIFDVDGTLVDSVDFHAKAWHEAFKEFGREVPVAKIREQIGKGGDQLLPVFFSPVEIERFGDQLEKRRSAIFKRKYLPQVRAFPKVRELFIRILRDGKHLALASSAKEDELASYKRIAKVDDLVQEETSADDAERSKPHPDIFQAALKRLGNVAPRDAIVVGDTPHDAEAASKAGLRTIGLLSGGWSAEELRTAGCIATYLDVANLLAHYDASPLAGPE